MLLEDGRPVGGTWGAAGEADTARGPHVAHPHPAGLLGTCTAQALCSECGSSTELRLRVWPQQEQQKARGPIGESDSCAWPWCRDGRGPGSAGVSGWQVCPRASGGRALRFSLRDSSHRSAPGFCRPALICTSVLCSPCGSRCRLWPPVGFLRLSLTTPPVSLQAFRPRKSGSPFRVSPTVLPRVISSSLVSSV